ncbi:MAG: transketolase C-terminal domain-containing protein [Candidatus Bathyarchaeia archaeon]
MYWKLQRPRITSAKAFLQLFRPHRPSSPELSHKLEHVYGSIEEGNKTGGVGAEIASTITEEAFDYLDAPVVRIAAPDSPIPYSPEIDRLVLIDENTIADAARKIC